MNEERIKKIKKALAENLKISDENIIIKDKSDAHKNHAGAKDGRGHFSIEVVSECFENKSLLERHRMIYSALDGLMETDIHALRIKALAPSEINQT